MKDKNQKKLDKRREMLDKMLAKMEDKKVKEFAQSIEDLSYFLSRKIDPVPHKQIDPIPPLSNIDPIPAQNKKEEE